MCTFLLWVSSSWFPFLFQFLIYVFVISWGCWNFENLVYCSLVCWIFIPMYHCWWFNLCSYDSVSIVNVQLLNVLYSFLSCSFPWLNTLLCIHVFYSCIWHLHNRIPSILLRNLLLPSAFIPYQICFCIHISVAL